MDGFTADQVTLLDVAEGYYGCRPIAIGAGSSILLNLYRFFFESSNRYAIWRCVPRVGYQETRVCLEKNGVMKLAYYDVLEELP